MTKINQANWFLIYYSLLNQKDYFILISINIKY